jgi:hypothetical protein
MLFSVQVDRAAILSQHFMFCDSFGWNQFGKKVVIEPADFDAAARSMSGAG